MKMVTEPRSKHCSSALAKLSKVRRNWMKNKSYFSMQQQHIHTFNRVKIKEEEEEANESLRKQSKKKLKRRKKINAQCLINWIKLNKYIWKKNYTRNGDSIWISLQKCHAIKAKRSQIPSQKQLNPDAHRCLCHADCVLSRRNHFFYFHSLSHFDQSPNKKNEMPTILTFTIQSVVYPGA